MEILKIEKKCSLCGEIKSIKEFYRDKYRKDGHSRLCKVCENKKSNKYYKENKKRRNYVKEKNKERNKEGREAYKKWVIENRDRYNELQRKAQHKRKAKEKNLINDFTEKQWKRCMNNFSNDTGEIYCCYCGEVTTKIEKEHFVAVNSGGGYTVSNMLPACKRCNSSKQDKDFHYWYPEQEFYSKSRENKIFNYLGYKNKVVNIGK